MPGAGQQPTAAIDCLLKQRDRQNLNQAASLGRLIKLL